MLSSSRHLQRSITLNGLFVAEGGSMFLLDAALAASLGLGARSDSLYAAWSLPLTIGRGAFQSLTNSLIGLFAEADDDSKAYSQALTVIGVLSLTISAVMAFSSRYWFPLSVPGATAETRAAGIPMAAILSWLIVLLALAETQRAIYYRAGRLVIPSAGRIIGALTSIGLILTASGENLLMFAAWGLVAGAAVEMLIGFIGFYAFLDFHFRFSWPDTDSLKDMTRVVGMPLLGQGVRVLAGVAERALASLLGPGALTAVTFSTRLITTMDRFVFRGFLVATIQMYSAGETSNYHSRMRLIALLAIPLAVVLALFAPQLIELAFGRGQFTTDDVEKVSVTIQAYAPAIVGLALTSVPLGLAYARRESRTVLVFFLLSSFLLIILESIFIGLGLDLRSFGIAFTITTFTTLLWLSHNEAQGMKLWDAGSTTRFLLLGGIVFMGTFAMRSIAGQVFSAQLPIWLILFVGGAVALALTGLAAWLLQLEELHLIIGLVRRLGKPLRA